MTKPVPEMYKLTNCCRCMFNMFIPFQLLIYNKSKIFYTFLRLDAL